MNDLLNEKRFLGINGLGRMGKLTLWYHLTRRAFDGVVINVGREVGKSLEDIIHFITVDSTYGSLSHFLYGHSGKRIQTEIIDREANLFAIDGFYIKILMSNRLPENINWGREGVPLVIECTGRFLDPTVQSNDTKGSLVGHLAAGARKVIVSAPFKIKNPAADASDFPTLIFGINHHSYNPTSHNIISAASCTTTGLAHMIKPLIENEFTKDILTASMSTVHAVTNTQSVLDTVPSANTSDLRKNRSALNNIILSSTGAAKTLEKVIPEIMNFGFMADSIRIPTSSVSLIALNMTFNARMNEDGTPLINSELIKAIYKNASNGTQKDLLHFSEAQNASVDILGFPAAVVIEGKEIHTRTGFLKIPVNMLNSAGAGQCSKDVNLPVTHAKILGWYDNEFGSYVSSLGKLTEHISASVY